MLARIDFIVPLLVPFHCRFHADRCRLLEKSSAIYGFFALNNLPFLFSGAMTPPGNVILARAHSGCAEPK
jgi:hypothetical protein